MEVARMFLFCFGVCGQLDNLLTMDPLGQHVGVQQSLSCTWQSPLQSRENFPPENLGLLAWVGVCVLVWPLF